MSNRLRIRLGRLALALAVGGLAVALGVSFAGARAPEREPLAPAPARLEAPQTLTVIETFNSDPITRWVGITSTQTIIDWHWRTTGQNCALPPGSTNSYPYSTTGRVWMGQYKATPPEYPAPYCNYGGVGAPGRTPITLTLTLSDSEAFFVPADGVHTWLSFWSWEKTEFKDQDSTETCQTMPYCDKDIRRVYIKTVLDSAWTKIWDTQVNSIIEGAWHQVILNIDPWRGQNVLLRFEFTTGSDAYLDHFAGWYVDQIVMFDTSYEVRLPLIMKSFTP
jgi:hypothetical protein